MAFLIKPFNNKTRTFAPGIISFEEREESAIADVKFRSGLGKFNDWNFSSYKKLREKQVKQKYNKNDE